MRNKEPLKVSKGKKIRPIIGLVYGNPGTGKSTFGSECKKPFFIGDETPDHIDGVDRFDKKVEDEKDFLFQLRTFRDDESMMKQYNTLVIDSIDGVEQKIIYSMFKDEEAEVNLQTWRGGFGKGQGFIQRKFSAYFQDYFIPIAKKMNVIFLCHSKEKLIEHRGSKKTVTQPALQKTSMEIIENAADFIFNIEHRKKTSFAGSKPVTVNRRYIQMVGTEFCIAKNRFSLEEAIEYNLGSTVPSIFTKIAQSLTNQTPSGGEKNV